MKDVERTFFNLSVDFGGPKVEDYLTIPRSVDEVVDRGQIECFFVSYLSTNQHYPDVKMMGVQCSDPALGRSIEKCYLNIRYAYFQSPLDEVRFLDKCIGNTLERMSPRFFASAIEFQYKPAKEELDAGFPLRGIGTVGYFPPFAVQRHSPHFWKRFTQSVLHDSHKPLKLENPNPWIRHFPDGGLMYRLADEECKSDLELSGLFRDELGVDTTPNEDLY